MATPPNIWLGYEYSINRNLFELMGAMHFWWKEYSKFLTFLKRDETPYLSLITATSYPEANIRELIGLTMSFVWAISYDDEILEKAKDPVQLSKYKQQFLQHFDAKDLDKAMQFSVYCNLILQVFFKLEPSMNANHKRNFRTVLEENLNAAIDEIEIINPNNESNFERFLSIRCGTSNFRFWELFEEVCRGVDMTKFADDPLFKQNKIAITRLVTFMNDCYSYNKELVKGLKGNLIYQIQRHFGCSSARAMQLGYQIVREEQRLFDLSSCELIESHPEDEDIKKYIRGLKDWAMANLTAYKHYHRYAAANHKAVNHMTAAKSEIGSLNGSLTKI